MYALGVRRVLVVSLAVLCAAWAGAAPIDFHSSGQTLGTAVERLGQQLGRKLYVSANIRDEVVVVHVTAVEPDELLKRLADVANAQWRTTASGDVLERTPIKVAELKKASTDLRAKEVREYLEQFAAELAKPFGADDARQLSNRIIEGAQRNTSGFMPDLRDVWARGPAARLAHRLLLAIDPDQLVDLPFSSRRVFTLNPTKLQYPLSAGAIEAFQKYAQEQNVWAATVAETPVPDGLNIVSNPLTNKKLVSDVPNDFYLEVKRMGMDSPLFCNLVIPRKDMLSQPVFQVIAEVPNRTAAYTALGRVTEVPESTPRLLRHVLSGSLGIGTVIDALSPSEAEVFYEPSKLDLAGMLAEFVLAAALSGEDLVALLGDGQSFQLSRLLPVVKKRSQFVQYLGDIVGCSVASEGGWTLIEPKDPHRVTSAQTPREAVRRLMADTRKRGRLLFEHMADLNSVVNEPSVLAAVYLRATGVIGWQNIGDNWHVSRLYGSLTDQQRRALAQGEGIPFGQMSQDQRRLFTALTVNSSIDSSEPAGSGLTRINNRGQSEPTILLADGIPPEAQFTLEIKEESAIYAYVKKLDGYGVSFRSEPGSVAYQEKTRLNPREGDTSQRPDGYAMGTLRVYLFRVRYSDKYWQTFSVREDYPDPDAKPGPWTDLPKEIVEQIKLGMSGG